MISFIIPTLNEEKVIEAIIRCLRAYAGPHEIIVSDGGSTDETSSRARRFADTVVVHTAPHRQTIAEGRNEGAKRARGAFLVFIDADVHVPDPTDFFSKALQKFSAHPNLVALTVPLHVTPQEATWADKIVFSLLINMGHRIMNNVFNIGAAPGEFQMIRRDAFDAVGGFNAALVAGEDKDMFYRLSKIGSTRYEPSLPVFHSGRRGHIMGWPKLLWLWCMNGISVTIRKKSFSKEWKVIR